MKARAFSSLLVAVAALAVSASGCAAAGMIFEFNGRTIHIEDMKQATLPRGLEVTHFDGRVMKVNGREPITVNGKELVVNGSNVTLGGSRHELGAGHKLVVEKTGKVSVVEQQKPAEKESWWSFWR